MHTPKIAFVVHCSTSLPRTLETRLSSDDELWVQQIKHDLFTYVGVLIQTIPSKVKKISLQREYDKYGEARHPCSIQ